MFSSTAEICDIHNEKHISTKKVANFLYFCRNGQSSEIFLAIAHKSQIKIVKSNNHCDVTALHKTQKKKMKWKALEEKYITVRNHTTGKFLTVAFDKKSELEFLTGFTVMRVSFFLFTYTFDLRIPCYKHVLKWFRNKKIFQPHEKANCCYPFSYVI